MHSDPLTELLQKRLAGETGSIPDDERSKKELPILWSFMTRRDVDGKLSKQPASVSIRLGLGQWLVTLTDPSLEVSLTTVVPVLSQSLEQLEVAIASPSAAWQPWKKSTGKFEKLNRNTPTREEVNSNH